MPYVNIKITKEGNVTPEQKRQLIEGATDLLHNVLGKNKASAYTDAYSQFGDPPATRTRDTLIKSQVLYRLSYSPIRFNLERVKGIEPSQPAWKAGTLPLSYTRIFNW